MSRMNNPNHNHQSDRDRNRNNRIAAQRLRGRRNSNNNNSSRSRSRSRNNNNNDRTRCSQRHQGRDLILATDRLINLRVEQYPNDSLTNLNGRLYCQACEKFINHKCTTTKRHLGIQFVFVFYLKKHECQ